MSNKILLIGCGQLGTRHLQAISLLKEIDSVYVVDGRQEGLALGRERLAEVKEASSAINWHWDTEIIPDAHAGQLCIIATQAPQRLDCLRMGIKAGYRQFLIEKVVAQSIADYQAMNALVKKYQLKVWVNCKTRTYGVHQHIKRMIGQDPVQMTVTAGNIGLGNNGVHAVDLFQFYDGSAVILPGDSRIDQVLYPSKRGSHVMDLSGLLIGYSERCSHLVVDFTKENTASEIILIQTANARFLVDHMSKFAVESYSKDNWAWKQIPIDERWEVSIMTAAFVKDILANGQCSLPSLEDCYPAHQFILSQLLPTFQRLLKDPLLSNCPIT